MALDDATNGLLRELSAAGDKQLHEMTPEEARGLGKLLREMYGPGPDLPSVRDHSIKTPDGAAITARVFVPSELPRAVVVYYHGGGWLMGAIDEFDTLAREIARLTDAVVVLAEYRLAPENRYPTAVRDAWAALEWVDREIEQLAGSRLPLIVAGDSSGGNLAAIVAQRARAEGGPEVTLQILVYPVVDADLETESYLDPANQLLLNRETMVWFWDHYAPDLESRRNADASPLLSEDLGGLPAAVVLTADHDVLRDEGEKYAERLGAAGVPVEHRRFQGQMHGFFTMVNVLPGSAEGLRYVADAIDCHLEASQPRSAASAPKVGG